MAKREAQQPSFPVPTGYVVVFQTDKLCTQLEASGLARANWRLLNANGVRAWVVKRAPSIVQLQVLEKYAAIAQSLIVTDSARTSKVKKLPNNPTDWMTGRVATIPGTHLFLGKTTKR